MDLFVRFGLYHASTGPNNWSNYTRLTDVEFRIREVGSTLPASTLGAVDAAGNISLNATGTEYFSKVGRYDGIIAAPITSTWGPYYASANRSINALNTMMPSVFVEWPFRFPSSGGRYTYYFALANDECYLPFVCDSYHDTSTGTGYGLAIHPTVSTSGYPVYRKSDNSVVTDINANNLLQCAIFNETGGSGAPYSTRFHSEVRRLIKVGESIRCQRFITYYGYTNHTNGFTCANSIVLTDAEVAFLTNAKYTPDPYVDGPTSTTSVGTTGTFNSASDPISLPAIPTLTLADTGFVRIYNPNLSQLKSLAQYMWTDPNFLTTILNHAKQLLENPIESVISLNMLPCAIPNAADEDVKVLFISTGVMMPPATTQFVQVDCGTVRIDEYYGSALDYSPYTKIHCFLPYIGQVTLNTDEVMGKTLNLTYRIDIVTGMCIAMIAVNGSVLYQFSGHCAISMPLTSADFSTYISASIQAAKTVAAAVAGGAGATGAAAGIMGMAGDRGSTTSKETKTVDTARNPKTGRQVTVGTTQDTSTSTRTVNGASFDEMMGKGVSNTVASVMGAKPIIEHSGGFTGNSGYMGVRRPYITLEIPRACYPSNYGRLYGYPSMITAKLSECEGYTEVQSVQLTGFSNATNPELGEISRLLKGGVIF